MIEYDDNVEERYGIKLLDFKTIRKEATLHRESFECFHAIVHHFMQNPNPTVVQVFNFEVLESPDPDVYHGVYRYQYDMKRLAMLTEDEKSFIYSAKDLHTGYRLTQEEIEKHERLKKELPELSDFIDEVFRLGRYTDVHGGNFMKDEDESYKIIDLEGFIYTPLSHEKNNWLRGT